MARDRDRDSVPRNLNQSLNSISAAEQSKPINLEAEQGLLGALLYESTTFDLIASLVRAGDFFEGFHERLFAEIGSLVGQGRRPDAVVLGQTFRTDPGLEGLGGARYLFDLLDRAPPGPVAAEYAVAVRDAAARRTLIELAGVLADRAANDGTTPASGLVEDLERALLGMNVATKTARLISADEAVDRVIEVFENPAANPGLMTGLDKLDRETGGFMPGELWLLGGRPSMGKSAIASTMSLNVAMNGVGPDGLRLGVVEVNGEMTVEQMTRRHIADYGFTLTAKFSPAYSDIRKRKPLTDPQRAAFYRAAQEVRGLETLKMVKKTGLTIATLRSMIRRQKVEWERKGIRLALVTVDHVGLFRPERETRSRTEAQTDIAIELKELADELGIAVVALAQLNRQLESRDDKRPQLSDLRDSGAWEENADGVIGTYRDAYYAARETEPKDHTKRLAWEARKSSPTVEAILLKIREGSAGLIELWADMGRNAIRDRAPDNLYGDASFDLDFNALPASAPATRPAQAQEPNLPPAPPLEAYDASEFE